MTHDSVPGADREEIDHHILVPGLPRHAQRRTPFALRTKIAALNPKARVHVCPAANEELNGLKLTVGAGRCEGVLVAGHALFDIRSAREKQVDYLVASSF